MQEPLNSASNIKVEAWEVQSHACIVKDNIWEVLTIGAVARCCSCSKLTGEAHLATRGGGENKARTAQGDAAGDWSKSGGRAGQPGGRCRRGQPGGRVDLGEVRPAHPGEEGWSAVIICRRTPPTVLMWGSAGARTAAACVVLKATPQLAARAALLAAMGCQVIGTHGLPLTYINLRKSLLTKFRGMRKTYL